MGAELTVGELECVFTGSVWAEGPLWVPSSQTVRWSDIPNDRILEFSPATGMTREYGQGVEFTNGRTLDADGTVVQCSHRRRRVERDRGGAVTGLVDSFQGCRLNSPNDVVIAGDSSIWFTDPPYGILPGTKEGHEGEQEYGGCYVFRFEPVSGTLTAVITELVYPNGLALFTGRVGPLRYGHRRAGSWRAVANRRLQCARWLLPPQLNLPRTCRRPGCRRAEGGRPRQELDFCRGGSARLLPVLRSPGNLPNTRKSIERLLRGGPDGQDLYITATTSLYRIRTTTRDAAAHS
jgi:gluconolactonase